MTRIWGCLLIVLIASQGNLAVEPPGVSTTASLDDRSLQISDGSRFVARDFYPEFSWETTPLYFMFGDNGRVHAAENPNIYQRSRKLKTP